MTDTHDEQPPELPGHAHGRLIFSSAVFQITDVRIRDAEGNLRPVEFPRTVEFAPNNDEPASEPIDVEETLKAIGTFEITAKPDLIVRDGNRTVYTQIGDGLKDDEPDDRY